MIRMMIPSGSVVGFFLLCLGFLHDISKLDDV